MSLESDLNVAKLLGERVATAERERDEWKGRCNQQRGTLEVVRDWLETLEPWSVYQKQTSIDLINKTLMEKPG